MAQNKEQRSYYRIDDDVLLKVKSVDKHQANQNNAAALFPESTNLQLLNEFNKLGRELSKINLEGNSALQAAFRIQDKRISLWANYLFAQHDANSRSTTVSLSEDGIAFTMDKAPYKGSQLALSMTFLSGGYSIFTFAEVLRVEMKGQQHLVAARFKELSVSDKSIIARHILASQRRPAATLKD